MKPREAKFSLMLHCEVGGGGGGKKRGVKVQMRDLKGECDVWG